MDLVTLTDRVASESRATASWSRRRGWVTAALAVVLVAFVSVNVWRDQRAGPTVHLFVSSYRPGPRLDQITVWYVFGNCDLSRKVSVVEQTPKRVVVAATARAGGCPGVDAYESVAHLQAATLTLEAPLGTRWVASDDGHTLHSVPNLRGVSDPIAARGAQSISDVFSALAAPTVTPTPSQGDGTRRCRPVADFDEAGCAQRVAWGESEAGDSVLVIKGERHFHHARDWAEPAP